MGKLYDLRAKFQAKREVYEQKKANRQALKEKILERKAQIQEKKISGLIQRQQIQAKRDFNAAERSRHLEELKAKTRKLKREGFAMKHPLIASLERAAEKKAKQKLKYGVSRIARKRNVRRAASTYRRIKRRIPKRRTYKRKRVYRRKTSDSWW